MEHSTLAGYSILLVEPDPHLASDLFRALDGAGARTLIALNSVDAVSLAESPKLSAAVLDYTQSVKDRHSVAERLKALTIPFVFSKDIGRNEPWPHAAVLRKPFSSAELIDLLLRLLNSELECIPGHCVETNRPEAAAERTLSLEAASDATSLTSRGS